MRVSRAPEPVQLRAHVTRSRADVTGVDPDRTQLWTCDLHRRSDSLGHVVGVYQEGRARAERRDLRREGGPLVAVQQRERVCGGARGGDAVATAGFEMST